MASGEVLPSILVVDDDEEAVALVRLLLERRGYRVETAADASEGLRRFERSRHRVVVSDLHLGNESGLELAQRLSREKDRPVLIAMSGDTSAAAVKRVRAAGFDHHVSKPIDWEPFLSLLAPLQTASGRLNETTA